ncbi:C39 family peptidase [Actinacidiphila rubida]|uniref:Peptidase_C39 like family protein n=1 Tax=Actinacidiphila rubida TaxID=310780 RepID=A0A1H8LIS3_9ACTN|nr:C39 family peptidase [Actinacidiphila rubida]SEO05044.1 Peptidase_C39 like family protein [Actinacidiphila rubida]
MSVHTVMSALRPPRRAARAAAALVLSVAGLAAGAAPATATGNGTRAGRPAGAAAHTPAPSAAGAAAAAASRVDFHKWTTPDDFASGTANGVEDLPGDRAGIDISGTVGSLAYKDAYLHTTKTYGYATWTSPVHAPAFGATEVVASWNAQTPAGTWLKVELNATMEDGVQTGWLDMGHWAALDNDIARTSVSPSAAPYGGVDTDTFTASGSHTVHAYQLRATLYRLAGSTATPRVWQVAAFASAVPARSSVPVSAPGGAEGVELAVPRYSQQIHAGEYKKYGGGGDAWCSPTSNEMIDEFWGAGPTAADMSWVDPSYADPSVDYAARETYDYRYQGTGNWPFNAGYASHFGLDAEVVQLRSADDVEQLVAAGIPVALSVAFDNGELTGSGYGTAGHLMVVVGFTASGDFIVNDPFSASDAQVRHVYARSQLENIWLRTYWTRADGTTGHGSGGVAYVITPHDKALPPVPDPANPTW